MRLYIFIVFLFLSLPGFIQAQFCTGTLGDNIFLEGNFGSGTANLQSPNPNIAPGYIYTFNVPPFDGEYVLTNNTATWQGLFPSWLAIGDNSTDPNGYMMIVNASNAPGLFYEQTVNGLCENTLYEFSADIVNLIKSGTPDHIDPNVSFLLNGVELFSTGVIPKTNNWSTYGFTFATQVGQESLTLSLRNNAPGGFGNDLAIDNISFRACGPETETSPGVSVLNVCLGDTPIELQAAIIGNQYVDPVIQWQQSVDQGMNWMDISGENSTTYTPMTMATGSYYYRFLVADGISNLGSDKCRVNSEAKIINVGQSTQATESYTICQGATLMIGNSSYMETGIYIDTFINAQGCDSLLTTDLTVMIADDFMAEIVVSPACINIPNGSISVENISGGTPPYTIFFEGIDAGTTTIFTDLEVGETYSIFIQDDIGCVIELTALIEEQTDLSIDLGDDLSVELGETITLAPSYNFNAADFIWTSTTPIDCIEFQECDNISFLPTTSQLVALEMFAGSGCSVIDSIFIEVLKSRKVYLPNSFSPNGDGVNDVFTIFASIPNVELVEEFKVFDRWGGLVFENDNFLPNLSENAWDGRINKKESLPGVYVYTTAIRFLDGEVIRYSGNVMLVR